MKSHAEHRIFSSWRLSESKYLSRISLPFRDNEQECYHLSSAGDFIHVGGSIVEYPIFEHSYAQAQEGPPGEAGVTDEPESNFTASSGLGGCNQTRPETATELGIRWKR